MWLPSRLDAQRRLCGRGGWAVCFVCAWGRSAVSALCDMACSEYACAALRMDSESIDRSRGICLPRHAYSQSLMHSRVTMQLFSQHFIRLDTRAHALQKHVRDLQTVCPGVHHTSITPTSTTSYLPTYLPALVCLPCSPAAHWHGTAMADRRRLLLPQFIGKNNHSIHVHVPINHHIRVELGSFKGQKWLKVQIGGIGHMCPSPE